MQLSLFLITFPAFIFNYALPAAIELDPQSSKTKAEELSGLDDHGHQMEDGIKEKRCKELPQFDFYDNILGSPIQSFPLDLKRRDLQGEFMKLKCDTCRTTSFCKLGTKCDKCDKVCNPVKINERSADPKDLVGLAPRINVENGLSENQERYYTVGSFGPGPKQTLLARLLNIPWNAKLDRLIVLAKNNAKTAQSLPPHPVIIDTAHVFTVNDGKPAELDVEVHNVKNDLDEPSKLTSKLNKELDAAIETKKKILQDSHLTPEEIDKIIEHAITQGNDPAVIIEENQNHHEDDNLALARDFSEEGVKKKKKKKGKGKKHEFEDDEETPIGMSNLENGNSFASDANVGNTLNANTNFENNSPMREFDESIPLVGKTQDNLESVNDDILESKFKKKKKGHGGYGYGMYRENENVDDIPTGDEIIGSNLEGNEEILESKFKKKKGGKGYGMYREHELMEDDDDREKIIGNTETQLNGNNGDILESKFKKKKGGKGYGMYRENEEMQDEDVNMEDKSSNDKKELTGSSLREEHEDEILESKFKKKKKGGKGFGKGYGMYRENEEMQDEDVNMEDISSNDKKELTGSSLREENEDEILESKFKKKKKGGKGYGKGYGMYRENEEMQDEQINADNISSDDNKQLVGSTLREENEDEILESKFKKKKKGGKGYGYYRENENFGQDNEDMPNFRSNYENAAYPTPANPPVAYEVPKQQFHEANQQYQSAPAYANSPQYETYQQPQTHQANQDYNVISVPAKSLPKPVSDSHYAYPAPAQSVPQPAYSNYPQQPEPPAPVYQEPLKTQQPTYTQITANQKPQVNPSYTQPTTYQQQQEPQANYQVPSINQPPPPSNPYPQSQMQPAYAPEPNQPSNQQQPSYGYPQSPMYNHQNYQDMVPIELDEEMPEYAPVQGDDYVVGSARQNPEIENDQMQQKEPRLRENWFEQQYHKLRNWVEENVGLEKPEDTLNDSTEEKHKAILDEFTSIIKNDLSEGKRLSESEDADLNKRIASLIKSENITAPRLADELTKMEDMVESNTDSIVNLKNLDELQSRFKSNDEMEDENKNIEDNVVGDRQINRWQMVNLTKGSNPETPEVNKAPLVDPNVVDLKTIMSGLKSVPHMVLDGAQKVANIIRPEGNDITVGDAQQTPTVEAEDKGNDTVGCSLEKDSDEETIYLQPPGYGYGYRESKNQDKLHLPTLDEIFHPHSKKKSHELSQFEELLHPQESRSGAKDKPVTGLPKLIQDLEHLTLPPIPGLKPHHKHHPSTLPPPPQYVDHNIPIPNNPNPPIENPNFNPNMPLNNNPFFNNNPPNDPNFNPNFNPNLNPNQQFMEPPPPFIPPQGFPNEFQSRHAHGHGHGGRHNIVGAQHMQNNPNFRHDLGHFGKIVPAELHDLNIHSRDVSEQMKGHKMYFVGDGIKLPLHMNKHDDGTLHLSVDMHKLCKCNQTNCKNEPHFLDTKITTDQDVPNALDDDDVNLGMAAPTSKELASSLDDKDIFKRSPDIQQKLNVYDEQFDEVLPIRNMHRENLENHINAFNEDVNRYYDNEISDKIPERKNNDEGDDDVVQQRVGLLTNVLSWMKDLVMEDAK